MKRLAALVVLFALLMAGCRAEVHVLLDVTEDGSGTLATEVGINNQLKDLMELAGDSETIISALDFGLVGEGSTRVEGDMTIYRTQVQFEDETMILDAAAGNFTTFDLELTEEGTSLEATLDLPGEVDLTEFPITPSDIDPETFEGHILTSLPGEIDDHNADEITTDGRLSWTIPLDEELYMFADTSYPQPSFPWWLVGLLLASVALAAGVWIAAVRRDKKSGRKQRSAPEPPPVPAPDGDLKSQPRQHSPFFDFEE